MSEQTTVVAVPKGEPPPPFDPDPDLVADVENNRFALRAFRRAARSAHDEAERQKGLK